MTNEYAPNVLFLLKVHIQQMSSVCLIILLFLDIHEYKFAPPLLIFIINIRILLYFYNYQSMKILIILSIFLSLVSSKILAILDNKQLLKTHSRFFKLMERIAPVQYSYSFQHDKIQLKAFDKFIYDHIIVMCTSQKQMQSKIKVKDIIEYFDDGGNVIVVGDVDISSSFRKIFYSFGVDLQQSGTTLKDNFNFHKTNDIIVTRNYEKLEPFIKSQITAPLIYRGLGLNLVNYQNYQLYNLVHGQATTYSRNIATSQTVKAGTEICLVAGIQGLNNARALLSGSLDFFSDQFLSVKQYGNQQIVREFINWTFKATGIIRVHSMYYHGIDVTEKETLYNVGEKIYFQAQAEQYDSSTNQWSSFITDDLQLQFVMLDPWVRSNLLNKGKSSVYWTQFYAPQKQGIYQFKIIYKKPGYNFITLSQRVTVRPYKHDEFERFILVAYPYYFGLGSTIIGTILFLFVYLYSSFGKSKKQ